MQITKLEDLDMLIEGLRELHCTFHNNNCGAAQSEEGDAYLEAITKLHDRILKEYVKRSTSPCQSSSTPLV